MPRCKSAITHIYTILYTLLHSIYSTAQYIQHHTHTIYTSIHILNIYQGSKMQCNSMDSSRLETCYHPQTYTEQHYSRSIDLGGALNNCMYSKYILSCPAANLQSHTYILYCIYSTTQYKKYCILYTASHTYDIYRYTHIKYI